MLFIQDLGKPEPHKNIQVYSEQLLKKRMLESLQIPHRAGLKSTITCGKELLGWCEDISLPEVT